TGQMLNANPVAERINSFGNRVCVQHLPRVRRPSNGTPSVFHKYSTIFEKRPGRSIDYGARVSFRESESDLTRRFT
ncbi:hypothetical protein, partial [Mycolicibacterium brumae]|uniref:hypothetical protein n=1 Tax=Mycolicibacterium brumae TaxID=85968 RepID=UPI00194FF59A